MHAVMLSQQLAVSALMNRNYLRTSLHPASPLPCQVDTRARGDTLLVDTSSRAYAGTKQRWWSGKGTGGNFFWAEQCALLASVLH